MIQYREIVRVLGDSRDFTLSKFRDLGGNASDWSYASRRAMANALTRAEDYFEIEHPKKTALRLDLKRVRRTLELELWP